MESRLRQFLAEEHAQDQTEYALLLVFVVLASVAIFYANGSSFLGIWGLTNSEVVAASAAASS